MRSVDSSVGNKIALEAEERIHDLKTLAACRHRLNELTKQLQEAVHELHNAGKYVVGYGASVGTTTMLFEFGVGRMIAQLFDDNPRKHGKYSPGFRIPCRSAAELEEANPDSVVVFAWRYFEQIRKKHLRYEQHEGHYILPLPQFEWI